LDRISAQFILFVGLTDTLSKIVFIYVCSYFTDSYWTAVQCLHLKSISTSIQTSISSVWRD